jgi:uncharacterized cupin superfamily protein
VRFGALMGAASTGMSVYELPPSQAIGPYHYENPEEEWLLVLAGRPTLRHPEGEEALEPWDVAVLPARSRRCSRGAERQRLGSSCADVLNTSKVAASVYPDSVKIAIWTGIADDDLIVRRARGVGYWDGEA